MICGFRRPSFQNLSRISTGNVGNEGKIRIIRDATMASPVHCTSRRKEDESACGENLDSAEPPEYRPMAGHLIAASINNILKRSLLLPN